MFNNPFYKTLSLRCVVTQLRLLRSDPVRVCACPDRFDKYKKYGSNVISKQ